MYKMKKPILLLLSLALSLTTTYARKPLSTAVAAIDPNEAHDIAATIDLADIKVWEAGERPHIRVTLTNQEAAALTVPVEVHLLTDTGSDYQDYAVDVTLSAGESETVEVPLTGLAPGFYGMTVRAAGNVVCTYTIGYNPTAIGCEDDAPADFWSFWDTWKARLETIDMQAELTELPAYSTARRKVYEVKLLSAPDEPGGTPVPIWGYYAEPVAAGSYPALIHYQGTDDGGGVPVPLQGDENAEWCELVLSTRGQMLSRVKLWDTEQYVDYHGDDGFYGYAFGDRERHYYRAAYLDCLRAVDFILSREKVDTRNIFATGASQGGTFTYVAAALSGKLKAIAPAITGHADFKHTKLIVAWPTNVFADKQAALGWSDDEIDTFNAYFDTKNFASRITCPTITNFSLQDTTDAPHLNIAPYNLLIHVDAADKAYLVNPFLGHATGSGWTDAYMAFFRKYISASTDTDR